MADMEQFIAEDPDVRFVLKEYPVLGEPSFNASRVSLAFGKLMPEKHPQFHIELLSMEGLKDGARAMELAGKHGSGPAEIGSRNGKNLKLFRALSQVYELADGLGISGTPILSRGQRGCFWGCWVFRT